MTTAEEDPRLFHRPGPPEWSPRMGFWLVSRYDDIITAVDDPETYSSAPAVRSVYDNVDEVAEILRAGNVPAAGVVVNEDEPVHTPMRRAFDVGFTGARIRALRPMMLATATELIDRFPARRAELVGDYATPFVRSVIDTVIGFPPEDTDRIQAWTADLTTLSDPLPPVEAKIAAAGRAVEYTRYLQAMIDDRRAHPRDDLASHLIHGDDGDGRPGLPDADIHCLVRSAARVAGFHTTRDAITSTLFAVLTHPEVAARVEADPGRALPRVTEEILRRDAPHRGLFRRTTRDTVLGGTPLPAGSTVLLLFGSGNRDASRFPDPDVVDIDRANARDHLAFGRGLHVCSGAPMARAEIRVALETLLTRLPGLRLAEGYRPAFATSYFFRGLTSLDVVW